MSLFLTGKSESIILSNLQNPESIGFFFGLGNDGKEDGGFSGCRGGGMMEKEMGGE